MSDGAHDTSRGEKDSIPMNAMPKTSKRLLRRVNMETMVPREDGAVNSRYNESLR